MRRWEILRGFAASSALALAAVACASHGDVNTVRGDATDARRMAEQANEKATVASSDAAAARAAAESAARDAREANEKADRIFQRSLHK